MRRAMRVTAGIALASLLVAQGSLAGAVPERGSDGSEPFALAFAEAPREGLRILDEEALRDTEGALWPLIGAVVTIDLALATFFWGAYVPTVTGSGGGLCTTCYLPGGRPR